MSMKHYSKINKIAANRTTLTDEVENKKKKIITSTNKTYNRSKTATKILNNNGFYTYNDQPMEGEVPITT